MKGFIGKSIGNKGSPERVCSSIVTSEGSVGIILSLRRDREEYRIRMK